MNIQHFNDQLLVQGGLSSFPTPHPPDPPKDIHLHVELDGVHAEDLVPDVGEHVARRDDAQPRGKLHHLLQNMCVLVFVFSIVFVFFILFVFEFETWICGFHFLSSERSQLVPNLIVLRSGSPVSGLVFNSI